MYQAWHTGGGKGCDVGVEVMSFAHGAVAPVAGGGRRHVTALTVSTGTVLCLGEAGYARVAPGVIGWSAFVARDRGAERAGYERGLLGRVITALRAHTRGRGVIADTRGRLGVREYVLAVSTRAG